MPWYKVCNTSSKHKHGGEKQSPVQPLGRKRKRLKVVYPAEKGESPFSYLLEGQMFRLCKPETKKICAARKCMEKQWEGSVKYSWRVKSGELVQGMSKRAFST